MARRAEDIANDPVIEIIDDGDEPTMTFREWLERAAADGITDVDADAAEILRDIREHGER